MVLGLWPGSSQGRVGEVEGVWQLLVDPSWVVDGWVVEGGLDAVVGLFVCV